MITKEKKLRKKPTTPDLGVFINLLTDFGFKRIFGIKELMINFLNTVLDVKGEIIDITYVNTERIGITKYDRKAIYDLFCITGNDERIIVEMHAIPQVYFKDRTLVYVSRLIQEQTVKGKDWSFELKAIYSVNILDFRLDGKNIEIPTDLSVNGITDDENMADEKYVSYVQLIDRDTHELFYDKLTLVYIELPRFTKKLAELSSLFEKWIFIIKHLHNLDDLPEELQNEIFGMLFEAAKIARMTKREVNNYLKDLSDMNIVKNEIRTLNEKIAAVSAERDSAWNTIAEKDKEIAEYRRLLGLNKKP